MSVGFLVTLPEQIGRFEPLVRRMPGARFLLARGRWPSPWLDSRAWTARILAERGFSPLMRARPRLDLVVTGGEMPEASVRSWLRPHGAVVFWRDHVGRRMLSPSSLVLAPGPAWLDGIGESPSMATGDPALDAALEPGAASRARSFLGLGPRGSRPLILIHAATGGKALDAMVPALAALRADIDLVFTASSARWLRRRGLISPRLLGPGVSVVSSQPTLAQLLAAADLVISEPGLLPYAAIALGTPALGLGSFGIRQTPLVRSGPVADHTHALDWIDEPGDVRPRVEAALADPRACLEQGAVSAERLMGLADGGATQRMLAALHLLRPPVEGAALPAGI